MGNMGKDWGGAVYVGCDDESEVKGCVEAVDDDNEAYKKAD